MLSTSFLSFLVFYKSKMLEHDRIFVSKGIGIFCHYWYFLQIIFIFQSKVCHSCHDLMQRAMGFNDI